MKEREGALSQRKVVLRLMSVSLGLFKLKYLLIHHTRAAPKIVRPSRENKNGNPCTLPPNAACRDIHRKNGSRDGWA